MSPQYHVLVQWGHLGDLEMILSVFGWRELVPVRSRRSSSANGSVTREERGGDPSRKTLVLLYLRG